MTDKIREGRAMTIQTFIGEAAEAAAKLNEPGLYVVQARDAPQYYRIGETDSLRERMKDHGGSSGLVGFADPNFCEMYRPWLPRWAAIVPRGQPYARLICENILTGEVGKRYFMMAGSSFEATAEAKNDLLRIAESLKETFERVFLFQTAQKFAKREHRAQRLAELTRTRLP
jgi:hypothetical protein